MKKTLFMTIFMLVNFAFLPSSDAAKTKLSDRSTMETQLSAVTSDPDLIKGYFPLILNHADREISYGAALVLMFTNANAAYLLHYHGEKSTDELHQIKRCLNELVPKLITAILPDDTRLAEQAILEFETITEGNS